MPFTLLSTVYPTDTFDPNVTDAPNITRGGVFVDTTMVAPILADAVANGVSIAQGITSDTIPPVAVAGYVGRTSLGPPTTGGPWVYGSIADDDFGDIYQYQPPTPPATQGAWLLIGHNEAAGPQGPPGRSDLTSVKLYGAIGDGTARTVNDTTFGIIGAGKRFATLTAAQAGTGITDLAATDQLDWAAHQWAVNDLDATGDGTLFTPHGRYMWNRTLTFPSGYYPDTATSRAHQVNWAGEGIGSTIKMTTDLGTGVYAVTIANRGTNGGTATKSNGSWRDLRLIGPGTETEPAPGAAAPCQMRGWGVGAERECHQLYGEFFWAAFDIVGDHSVCVGIRGNNSYYGLFLGYSSNLFGDWTMIDCQFARNARAGIAIHGDSGVTNGFKFIKGGCFYQPYGIIKLSGTNTMAFQDSEFEQFMFEDCGNAPITDEASIAGNAPTAEWLNVEFRLCAFGFNSSRKITAEGAYALLNIGKASRFRIRGIKNIQSFVPGSRATFDIAAFNGCHFEGDIDRWAIQATAAGLPTFFRRTGNNAWTTYFKHVSLGFSGGWEGEGFISEAGAAVTGRGYVLRQHGTTVQMAVVSTAQSNPVAGVALEAAAINALVLVAARGHSVPVQMTTSTPTGQWMTLSTTPGALDVSTSISAGRVVAWLTKSSGTLANANITGMEGQAAALMMSQLGVANGAASLDATGVVPSSQLPAAATATFVPSYPVPPSGNYWFTAAGNASGPATIANGILRVHPWVVPKSITITRIGGEVTTAGDAGSTVRLVIYSDNGSGYPGSLLLDAGTISGATVASQEIVLGTSTTLTPGIYWVGGVVQGVTTTSPALRLAPQQSSLGMGVAFTALPGANAVTLGYSTSGVTGTPPATFPNIAAGGGNSITIPRTFVRT